jgi:hypothetical protein
VNRVLHGHRVLEFTVAPSCEVRMYRMLSGSLDDNGQLEDQIAGRVRRFRFPAREDVGPVTRTKPFDFSPPS